MALYANMERFFLDAATNQRERKTFLVEPVSRSKAGVQFYTSFTQAVS